MRNVVGASLPAPMVLALLVGGCGSGSDLGSSSATPSAGLTPNSGRTVPVVMKSLDFSPLTLNARVGQTVIWTNQDGTPHNVTYLSGPRFTSSRSKLDWHARFSLRLTKPGTIHYQCTIHPWMKATIVVSP